MKYRYLSKFNLQQCAVLSQISEHLKAIEKGKLAVGYCQESFEISEKLCERLIHFLKRKQHLLSSPIKSIDNDNAAQAYSVTSETRFDLNNKNKFENQSINRKQDGLNKKTLGSINSPKENCFGSRTSSISSSSSKMSITIKEDIKQDQMERLHSFSLKRSSVVSSKNKFEQEKLNNILKKQSNHGTEKQTLSSKLKA